MRSVDKIPAWPVWDQIARAHHDASNISDGGPVARLKDIDLSPIPVKEVTNLCFE